MVFLHCCIQVIFNVCIVVVFLLREEKQDEELEPHEFALPQIDGAFDDDFLLVRHSNPRSNGRTIMNEDRVPLGSAPILEPKAVTGQVAEDCDIRDMVVCSSKLIHMKSYRVASASRLKRESDRRRTKLRGSRSKESLSLSVNKSCNQAVTTDSSDEGDFVIPQFDGANDVLVGSGRKQRTNRAHPFPQGNVGRNTNAHINKPAYSSHSYTSASQSHVISDRRYRGGRPESTTLQSVPYSVSSQGPVPSSHNKRVPGSASLVGSSQSSSLDKRQPQQSHHGRTEYHLHNNPRMHSQAHGYPGRTNQHNTVPPSSQASSRPMYITPIPGAGMPQKVPGVGNAYVAPALLSSKEIKMGGVKSSSMVLPSRVVSPQQEHGARHPPSLQSSHEYAHNRRSNYPVPQNRRDNQRNFVPSDNHPGSRHSSAPPRGLQDKVSGSQSRARQTKRGFESAAVPGPLEAVMRQNSSQSVYSPISDDSDNDLSDQNLTMDSGISESGMPKATESSIVKEDILKQALSMTLDDSDMEMTPMEEFFQIPEDTSALLVSSQPEDNSHKEQPYTQLPVTTNPNQVEVARLRAQDSRDLATENKSNSKKRNQAHNRSQKPEGPVTSLKESAEVTTPKEKSSRRDTRSQNVQRTSK